MNNFFKALYRKKVSGNAKRIIIAYKKTIIFYWLYERKNKVFFIISTILRSYLHYFILFEFSIKRHDVFQYMYHLNTLDLFHLFENISTNIFFSLSVICFNFARIVWLISVHYFHTVFQYRLLCMQLPCIRSFATSFICLFHTCFIYVFSKITFFLWDLLGFCSTAINLKCI